MTKEEVEFILSENNKFLDTIIKDKYLIGKEKNWKDICQRLVKHIDDKDKKDKLLEIFEDKRCVPGGSIISNIHDDSKKTSLSNCYFIPIKKDNIEDIFEFLKEAARTFSYRGGVGTDISILRPKSSQVRNSAKTSTGSVSFLPLMSDTTNIIDQAGRRGAMIVTINDWHPDIFDFIECKSNPEKVFGKDPLTGKVFDVTGANLSIKISKEFMECLQKDGDWDLIFPDFEKDYDKYNNKWDGDIKKWIKNGHPVKIYKTIKAKELWDKIIYSSWKSGDPGIVFWDNIMEDTVLSFNPQTEPKGLNPCGEQLLPNYGNCLLGAQAYYKYVKSPWSFDAAFNIEKFLEDLKFFHEYMDGLIDINTHPLEVQNIQDRKIRKVGIEATGLTDCCAMLGFKYGTSEFINFITEIEFIKNLFLLVNSIELAKIKGPAPIFENKLYRFNFLNHKYIQNLLSKENKKYINLFKRVTGINITFEKIKNDIKKYGLRNTAWTTFGPTGTISLLIDNCCSGIEPLFALEYFRESRITPDIQYRIIHPVLFNYLRKNNPKDLDLSHEELLKKYNYIEAHDIEPNRRILVQNAIQLYTTDSISSTINLKKSVNKETISDIFINAYKHRLKGITVFREGCKKGVLTTTLENNNIDNTIGQKLETKDIEKSYRFKVLWKNSKVYVNVVYVEDSNGLVKKPIELFANIPYSAGNDKNGNFDLSLYNENKEYWDTICRLISLCLRYNLPIDEIKKQLHKATINIVSLNKIILRSIDYFNYNNKSNDEEDKYSLCPECKTMSLKNENSCVTCISCGYSKCS